jgi:photosystem II stability/assembly factor-like uncharacterized protein
MKIIYCAVYFILTSISTADAGWFLQNSGTGANLRSVIFNHGNENIAWTCGENGTILFTSNGGVNWIQQNSGTTTDLYAIVFMEISEGPVFACGENGLIFRTSNSGTNWNVIPSNVSVTLKDISDFNFVAVGDSGVILKSSNQGLTWYQLASPTVKNLYAVSAVFSNYIVGQEGTILNGIGSGTIWSLGVSGVTNNLYGVPLFGSRDIAVGAGGVILRSTNNGTNWFTQNSFTQRTIRSTEYSVNNTSIIYCAGDSGLILKTTDYGNHWGFQNSSTDNDLYSVFFYLDDNTGYAVGNNGTILKTTDGGGITTSVSDQSDTKNIPSGFMLYQNYPNPFNPATVISYSLSEDRFVSLKVYDVRGNEIAALVNEKQNRGNYNFQFSSVNYQLSSGIYYCSLKINGILIDTKRMVLLK